MSKITLDTTDMTAIGDAIRTKLDVETLYKAGEMPAAILSIPGGGITPTGTISIDSNGAYDVTQYATAEVDVSGGGALNWRDTLSVNWNFANPVNTRGQSSYSGSSLIYTLDGWQLQGGTLTFVQGGIKLSRYAAATAGYFMQRYKSTATAAMIGRQLTLSVIVDGDLASQTATTSSGSGSTGHAITLNDVKVRGYNYGTEIAVTIDIAADTDTHVIQAIKLEAGSNQTLATQVNGVWVLNNSMDAGTEYIKARYGTVYNS